MVKKKSAWFVIADGARARIVVPRTDAAGYATAEEIVSMSARLKSADLGSDKPGRAQESATSARHAVTPRTDPHQLEKERFAALVAEKLNGAQALGAFDGLILVALPRFLEDLRKKLNGSARASIVAELPKDLTGVPDPDLVQHLDPVGPRWAHPHITGP